MGFGGLPHLPEDVEEDATRGLTLPLAFFRGVGMLSISLFFQFFGITDENVHFMSYSLRSRVLIRDTE